MSFQYTNAKRALWAGEIDLAVSGDTIRARLVMTNTTCDTEKDKATLSAFTLIDLFDGAGYVEKTLANQLVRQDDPNLRAEFDADDLLWTAISAGTRQAAGILLYKFVTNDADSIPLFYIDQTGFPFTANGGNFTYSFNAEGIAQHT